MFGVAGTITVPPLRWPASMRRYAMRTLLACFVVRPDRSDCNVSSQDIYDKETHNDAGSFTWILECKTLIHPQLENQVAEELTIVVIVAAVQLTNEDQQ
jgi:hypothetical protein